MRIDDVAALKGNVAGLYGRMPVDLQRLVRKIADASDYDHGAMELLDAFKIEWRLKGSHLDSVVSDDAIENAVISVEQCSRG